MCLMFGMGILVFGSKSEAADSASVLNEQSIAEYKSSATQTIQIVTAFTDEDIDSYLSQSNSAFVINTVESWNSAREELGTFVEITSQEVEADDTQVTVTSIVKFEKGTATVPYIIDVMEGPLSMSFDVNYTLGQKMEKAGLNTVMGIGIVFLMLIFLSFIISLFRFVPKLEKGFSKKKEAPVPAPVPVPVRTEPVVQEELVDDGELVAVIAAAIAASENTSTDSFRVRSIKKANARRWKNV